MEYRDLQATAKTVQEQLNLHNTSKVVVVGSCHCYTTTDDNPIEKYLGYIVGVGSPIHQPTPSQAASRLDEDLRKVLGDDHVDSLGSY